MNFIDKNKAIMKIADTFGVKNQRLKLIEELSELIKELSLENSTLKEKLEEKDLKIAELYLKLSKAEGLLNKYMNHVKMNEGREL